MGISALEPTPVPSTRLSVLAGQLDPEGWVDAGAGRRWRPPNVSSLSRARGKLGADPLHMLFEQVAGPVGADGAPGVFCCGLRMISVDGSVTDLPDTPENGSISVADQACSPRRPASPEPDHGEGRQPQGLARLACLIPRPGPPRRLVSRL
jgi:hypothetical protein